LHCPKSFQHAVFQSKGDIRTLEVRLKDALPAFMYHCIVQEQLESANKLLQLSLDASLTRKQHDCIRKREQEIERATKHKLATEPFQEVRGLPLISLLLA
jgi:hypothetical protein